MRCGGGRETFISESVVGHFTGESKGKSLKFHRKGFPGLCWWCGDKLFNGNSRGAGLGLKSKRHGNSPGVCTARVSELIFVSQ